MSAEPLFLKDEKGIKYPKILRGGICPHKPQFSPFFKENTINSAIFATYK
jgi:hypothetical protein